MTPNTITSSDGMRRQFTKYLIRWVGQSAREDCWVQEEDFIGCKEAIEDFERRQATADAPDNNPALIAPA